MLGAAAGLLAWLAAAGAAAAAGERPVALRWDEAFPIDAAPESVHFVARYRDGRGAWHALQTWRQGDDSLHRRTDDRIDLFARHDRGDWRFRLLDAQRHIAADVSRTNLYRIGVFTDAFGLAHVMDRPKGRYRIETAQAPEGIHAGSDCRWRALLRPGALPARTLVCWSTAWGLPLAIVDADAAPTVVFRVDGVDTATDPMAAATLPPVPAGYAMVDVDEDIDPTAD